jgi:DNA repair protein RecN (Recombination protein N)
LAAVSELLINICGQHEHQVILNTENHIDILDEFGGCLPDRAAYVQIYNQYQHIRTQIEELKNLRSSREEKTDLFRFQLKEIQDVNPQPAEDTALVDEKKVLVNFQKLSGWANLAYDLLYGEKDSAIVKLKEVQNQVKEIKKIDANLKLADTDIEDSFITLQEAALTLRDYSKNLFFDSERLAAIDERLELLNRLKRKYGGSLEGVLRRKQEIAEDLKGVFSVEEGLETLGREEEKIKNDLRQNALELSQIRKQAAKKLQESVDKEVHALNMPHASFQVNFKKSATEKTPETFGLKGCDEPEFYLAANTGEESKPLNKIASGGELSRIILALKNVLSRTGSVASIVFDEVDNGIGGAVAEIVGRKLKEVSANHQVICITHLPQIACFGDSHLYVSKKVVKGRTITFVEELDDEQKIEEISRMLGGVNVTKATREHASEMINGSKAYKFDN